MNIKLLNTYIIMEKMYGYWMNTEFLNEYKVIKWTKNYWINVKLLDEYIYYFLISKKSLNDYRIIE